MVINKREFKYKGSPDDKYQGVKLRVYPKKGSRLKKCRGYRRKLINCIILANVVGTTFYDELMKTRGLRNLRKWLEKNFWRDEEYSKEFNDMVNELERDYRDLFEYRYGDAIDDIAYDMIYCGKYSAKLKIIDWFRKDESLIEAKVTDKNGNLVKIDLIDPYKGYSIVKVDKPYTIRFEDWRWAREISGVYEKY